MLAGTGAVCKLLILFGERGIRTPDTVAGMPDFESGRFNHSRISPDEVRRLGQTIAGFSTTL